MSEVCKWKCVCMDKCVCVCVRVCVCVCVCVDQETVPLCAKDIESSQQSNCIDSCHACNLSHLYDVMLCMCLHQAYLQQLLVTVCYTYVSK